MRLAFDLIGDFTVRGEIDRKKEDLSETEQMEVFKCQRYFEYDSFSPQYSNQVLSFMF